MAEWTPPREALDAPDPEPVHGVDPGPDACHADPADHARYAAAAEEASGRVADRRS